MIMHAEKNEQADQRRNEESAVDARTQRRLLYRARLRSPTSTTRKSLVDAPPPNSRIPRHDACASAPINLHNGGLARRATAQSSITLPSN